MPLSRGMPTTGVVVRDGKNVQREAKKRSRRVAVSRLLVRCAQITRGAQFVLKKTKKLEIQS